MGDVSLTPLGITVLGLLSERSMHPYEMYQLASVRRGDQLVKIKPGSLYHMVSRLEKQELLASIGTDREGNRPERTTYEITARGREALEHQLREMLAVPVREYPRLPLALAEMHNLSASTACQMLRIRLAHLDKTIAKFEADYEALKAAEKPRIFTVGADYAHALTVAEREWIGALVTDIESGEMPWLSQELLDRLAGSAGSSALPKD
ncbi:PadR family transcriptional regulator [Rhodococcus qingshengii]|uniref:PadR family transcriptional regulator n=1 Tax=Rhodococcus qingshengii TaxID=334542 RepID=UPI0028F24268|nr:PadR family transcriptional regulator [Rhodococcus qingshengii]MDT9664032.1 PadR family transcriptional regulator [Rhodococcus qingshengii]